MLGTRFDVKRTIYPGRGVLALRGLLLTLIAGAFIFPAPSATAAEPEVVIPGLSFHGIHGLTFDSEDRLYVGSVIGSAIYRIDTETGEHETFIGAPEGMADDLEFAADGTLVWTSFLHGKIRARKGDGPIRELATGLPGMNSMAFKQDGRLFATQVFLGDALYEIDFTGQTEPRLILKDMGGLNGFDFGPDGMLYGPLWFKGQVAKVDVDTGELTVVAEGFKIPAAANFDSQGNLYVLDTGRGHYYRVDTTTGEKTKVAELGTSGDNIAFNSKDQLFGTIIPENAVFEINTETGATREVLSSKLCIPAGLALYSNGDEETLYTADVFSTRAIDLADASTRDVVRNFETEIEYPTGASVNEKHLVLASFNSGTVSVLDRASGDLKYIIHGVSAAYDALELDDGSILVAQVFPGKLLRFTGEHGENKEVIPTALAGATCLAKGEGNTVYVTENFGSRVSKVDLGTYERTDVAVGIKSPEGIAVAPDGRLIVAEVGLKRIIAIDPDSGEIEVIAEDLPIGLEGPAALPKAWIQTDVEVAADGTIYFSADLEDAIYKIPPE